MDTQSQPSFFDNVSIYFDQAASFTEYPTGLLEQIEVKIAVCDAELGISPKRID